ncbi:lipoprotein [Psychroserpens sp. XS_ASV72]|uniref:lipoprotein n=1 Tax=Psychroserpens sp. XS_ASV72 TaxID=3241293 RepID=UPI00351722F6
MKRLIFGLFSLLILSSCNFTEEITFNEDGSGEFVMSYDMGEVMKAVEGMTEQESKEKKEKVKLDSVVYFKDLLVEKADSIAQLPVEEQEQLKALEDIVMKMNMDEANGVMKFGFGASFTSLADLPNALDKIDQAKKMNSRENPQYSQMDNSAVTKASENMLEYVDYNYDGKTFSRFLKKDFKQSEEDLEALNNEIAEMGEAEAMFEAMSYTLLYHFPKPIKSVSNKNAQISDDGKSVSVTIKFLDMVRHPENTILDVTLED